MTNPSLFRNVGTWDRAIRTLAGLLLIIIGWTIDDPSLLWMRVAGLYPLLTGWIGWCPIYALLRLDSSRPGPPS